MFKEVALLGGSERFRPAGGLLQYQLQCAAKASPSDLCYKVNHGSFSWGVYVKCMHN